MESQLPHQIAPVRLDGLDAEVQEGRNLLIAPPLGQELGNLVLAPNASLTVIAQPNFGTCDSRLWLEQSPGAPTPTTLYQIGTGTNPLTFNPVGTTNLLYNAVGYNTGDNYQYGLVTLSTNTLVRAGADGTTVSLGAVSGLPVATYISGAFGTAANILYGTDFESGAGGWTHTGTGDTWALSATNPHSWPSHS